MVNFRISSLFLLLSSMAVNASDTPFKGAYMGLGVGVSSQVLKNESSGLISVPGAFDLTINQKTKGTSADPLAANFSLGYSTVFEKFYSAIEARFGVQRFKNTQSFDVQAMNGGAVTTTISSTSTVKSAFESYAILLKPGILYRPNTVFYGILGAEMQKFTASTSLSDLQNIGAILTGSDVLRSGSNDLGWLLGVGMEVYVTEAITIGAEYLHTEHGKIKLPDTATTLSVNGAIAPGSSLGTKNKLTFRSDTLFAKMAYHF